MSVFADAVDAQFEDPHLAQDAIWHPGGGADGILVRVRRRSPEAVIGQGDNRFDLNAMLLDVRLSEVPDPREGDTVDLMAEDGEIAETVTVTGLSDIDRRKLVRTCEVSPVEADADP